MRVNLLAFAVLFVLEPRLILPAQDWSFWLKHATREGVVGTYNGVDTTASWSVEGSTT